MVGLLPLVYSKIFKREKVVLRIFSICVFLGLVFLVGTIFLLPSYFTLVFSLEDVLRGLETEEISLARKDVGGLESKILYINSLIGSYTENENKRKPLSNILLSLSDSVPEGIRLIGIEFEKSTAKEYFFRVRGEADKRSFLISYLEKVRQLPEIKELRSPVSNLLLEENVKFIFEAVIKAEYYNEVD